MSGGSSLWRAILWVERFLPTPAPVASEPEQVSKARRRAALVPLMIWPAVFVPILFRRTDVGELLRQNHVVLEQLMLVLACCIAVAAFAFGMKAWRDARAAR